MKITHEARVLEEPKHPEISDKEHYIPGGEDT